MKILYIPLDERPCNYKFPILNASGAKGVEIITPPLNILGNKKEAANIDQIWKFIKEKAIDVDYAILSMDMLLYGGLIPSRLHDKSKEITEYYFDQLQKIKTLNPTLKVFGFQCIMRSPQYNSAEEEPSYYEKYGEAIHRSAYLKDKEKRQGLIEEEKIELDSYDIPLEYLDDYESRIKFNLEYNLKTLDLVSEKVVDFLVIPQDDSSPFGYTALSQETVLNGITNKNIDSKVRVYPGADEVGSSLITRAYLEYNKKRVKVFTFYSSTLGPTLIPLYEDRPMNESLKSHLEVCNLERIDSPEEADLILAYNSPGKIMEEAEEQENKDVTYDSYRNMLDFGNMIKRYVENGKLVGICDSAYANGGDIDLFRILKDLDLLSKINGYAGWNTNCNSLGTTLSSMVFNSYKEEDIKRKNVYYRLIEDVLYQSIIRKKVTNDYLPRNGLSYFELNGKENEVSTEIEEQLNKEIKKNFQFEKSNILISNVSLPWKRMFELDFNLIQN